MIGPHSRPASKFCVNFHHRPRYGVRPIPSELANAQEPIATLKSSVTGKTRPYANSQP